MKRQWPIAAAIALLLAGCREQPVPAPPAIRLAFPVPADVDAGSLDAAISPDESGLVFVATSKGVTQLWRRALSAERADPIPGTEGAQLPAWKRTGNAVSFFAAGRLKQVSIADGTVTELADAPSPSGATWLADGSLLFAPDAGGVIKRLLNGQLSDATRLGATDKGHVFPVARGASGDFVYVAVQSDGRRVARLVTATGEHQLTTTSGHAQLLDDVFVHVQDGVLLAYLFDPEKVTLPGRGVPLALDIGVAGSGRGLFAASGRLLLHARAVPRRREVVWLGPDGARLNAIGDVGDHWQVRLSPDDRHAAVTSVDPLLRTLDVFVTPTSGIGDTSRLTLSLSADSAPAWSPDGSRVLFRSLHEGVPGLFARRAHTTGAADDVILESPLDETPSDWGTNGHILFHARSARGFDVFRLDPATGQYGALAETPFNETDARWSPDARWIAFVSDESGQPDVYAQDRNGIRQRISFGGGTHPRWRRDSRTIVFLRGAQVLAATLDVGGQRFANAQPAFELPGIVDFDLAHRSDRLIAVRTAAAAGASGAPSAVLNWQSLVERDDGGRR